MKNSHQGNVNVQRKTVLRWTELASGSFELLRQALISAPVLAYPSRTDKFILDCDASHECMGAVLSQVQNGNEKVIAYASKKFSKSELAYCITRKELLSVYTFTTHFKHYLLGNRFLIRTDHKALIWMLNWKKPNTAQYCNWIAELQIYDFEIQHRIGKDHINADFLSRPYDCEQCELPHADPKRKRNVKLINGESENLRRIYNIDETSDKREKNSLIRQFHNGLGHLGIEKTLLLLKESYNWPNIYEDVKDYINKCMFCAKRKVTKDKKNLGLHITANFPFQKLMIDVTGPLPKSTYGHKFVLGVIDIYSRYTMLIPLKTTDSKQIINVLFKNWVAIFGCPEMILSDGGSNLNSKMMKQFCLKFHVKKHVSSPYHPESNGTIERCFRTVKDMIYATCTETGSDWVDALPLIEIGLRASCHKSTGFSPHEIIFGCKMRLPQQKQIWSDNDQTCVEFMRKMANNRMLVRSNLKSTVKGKVESPSQNPFVVGAKVLVRKLCTFKANMLEARYFGPCTIIEKLGEKSYRLVYNGKTFKRSCDHFKICAESKEGNSVETSVVSESSYQNPIENNHENEGESIMTSIDEPEVMASGNVQENDMALTKDGRRYPVRSKKALNYYGYT